MPAPSPTAPPAPEPGLSPAPAASNAARDAADRSARRPIFARRNSRVSGDRLPLCISPSVRIYDAQFRPKKLVIFDTSVISTKVSGGSGAILWRTGAGGTDHP